MEEGGLGGLLGDEEDKGNEGKRRAWSGGAAVPRTRTCWGSLRRCTVAWARMRRRALRRTFGEEAWGAGAASSASRGGQIIFWEDSNGHGHGQSHWRLLHAAK